jgi:uncharacterized phage infection (PIP) family protein YhgE
MTVTDAKRCASGRILLDVTIPRYQKRQRDLLLSQEMSTKVLTFLILSFASAAVAEDFKTLNGKEYKDAAITRVEPDGIVVKTKSGVTKVYFPQLPKEVQERFHYDSEKSASYSAEQAANYAAYQKEQEETRRQQQETDAKNKSVLVEQQAAANRTQGLQARYAELQRQEDDLLRQIGEANRPGPEYRQGKSVLHHPNPLKAQLPVLQSHLSDVRREKSEVRKELAKASDSNKRDAGTRTHSKGSRN